MKRWSMRTILIAMALAVGNCRAYAADAVESPQQRDARMAWWREARFGMFIHWDPSSIKGVEISWGRNAARPLDVATDAGVGAGVDPEYDTLYQKFNPTHFDARRWVAIAQEAGMKYLVITCKHHDGFCMWDTKLTNYNIMNSPFHRDVIKELADACHAAGLRFGIYYSPRDWHNPDYGVGDNRKYIAYMNGQLRELLTNYGTVDEIWFDSYGRGDLLKFWHVDQTWNLIKSLQPAAVVNNRLTVLGAYGSQPTPYLGDFDTPEQHLGSFQRGRAWESCMSIVSVPGGGGWSYRPDGTVKSGSECVRQLVGCATGDGNLLLDVGPNALGEIPADQVASLREIGQWMRRYGQTIYGTRGGPYRNDDLGGSTYRGDHLFLHVFNWPVGGRLILPRLKAQVVSCASLTGGNATVVNSVNSVDSLCIALPIENADRVDTIIDLRLNAPVENELTNDQPLAGLDVPTKQ